MTPRMSAAEAYQAYFVPAMFAPWASALVAAAHLSRGEVVVDEACGIGAVARAAAHVAFCQHGLTFMPDKVAALAEMRRMLDPAGSALTLVLQGLDRHPVFDSLIRSVSRHLGAPLEAVAVPFALPDAATLIELHAAAGFGHADVSEVSITASFLDPDRFVPMAVASSAAAVPTFAALDDPSRRALVDAIALECADVIGAHTSDGVVSFPMYAHLARAQR